MATEIKIVPATAEHAELVARTMRLADRLEVEASCGFAPLEALRVSMKASSIACTALFAGEPGAMFGVAPAIGGVGVVWMLTAELIERHWRAFARRSRAELDVLQQGFLELTNFVDARHVRALRWARWAGFHVEPAQAFGLAGLPFHRIRRFRRV